MDEFERRLRASLAARAEDVEPTPALWVEVQDRVARNRRQVWAFAALGTAAAVLLAVIVVPNILNRGPGRVDVLTTPTVSGSPSSALPPTVSPPVTTPTPPGTEEPPTGSPSPVDSLAPPPPPTDGPGTGDPVVPDRYVTTDGTEILLHMADGQTRTLYTQDPTGESSIVSLAVRPAGDRDGDTTIVFLSQGEGMWFLRYLVISPDTLEGPEQFPTEYDITDSARVSEAPPAPVWSPDGRHLAWIEDGPDTMPKLRVIGWRDGPGTRNPADDNAENELAALDETYATIEDWVWIEGVDTETAGYLFISAPRDGGAGGHLAELERQGDGAIAFGTSSPWTDDGTFYVDYADSHANDGAPVGPAYTLAVGDGQGEGAFDLELTWSADGDQSGALPVPPELTQGNDPSAYWMTARDDAMFLGQGDQAWLITRDSEIEQFDGSVRDAAFLPN